MRSEEDGDESRQDHDERLHAGQEPPGHDPTLLALESLVGAAEQMARMAAHVTARAAHIRARRLEGVPYR